MTQTMSSDTARKNVRKNVPLHYARCLSKSSANISTAVVCTCMHLLGMPAVLLSVILYFSDKLHKGSEHYFSEFDGSIPYIVIGCLAFIIAFLAGSNAAMNSFTHLYNKQNVDMELSLPMSYKQRFVSGYFTGLATYILPYIAVQILSMILFLAGHITLDGKTAAVSGQTKGVTCDVFETLFPYYIEAAAGVLVIMIMFYTMWVLTMTFCGSKLEAVLYGTGANLIMPAIFSSVLLIIDSTLYGSTSYYYIALGDTFLGFLISCTSPAGAAFALIQYIAVETDTSRDFLGYYLTDESNLNFLPFIVSVLAVSAVFFFAAMFVYSRRKAEDTGKSFAVKGFYYLVLSCMMFLIITVTMCFTLDLVPVIIVSAAAYVILDCICERGVKRIGVSCLKYIVTTLVCLSIFFLPSKTGCLGAAYRVPDVSEISSVELIDYWDYFSSSIYYWNFRSDSDSSIFTYSDKENIGMITDMHRAHLEYYKEHPELNSPFFSSQSVLYSPGGDLPLRDSPLVIRYKLKNGFTLTRTYAMYCGALEKIINLDTSDEAKENYIAGITKEIEKLKGEYKSFSAYVSGRFLYSVPHDAPETPPDFFDRLLECLTEDIQNVSNEEYIHPERNSYGEFYVQGRTDSGLTEGRYIDIRLFAYHHKTVEYLKSIGLDPDERYIERVNEGIRSHLIQIGRFDSSFGSPVSMDSLNEVIMTVISVPEGSTIDFNAYAYDSSADGIFVYSYLIDDEDMEELCEIYANSVDLCVPETDCYTVKTPWSYYSRIPEQYSSAVERFYEKYMDYGFKVSPETGEIVYMTE